MKLKPKFKAEIDSELKELMPKFLSNRDADLVSIRAALKSSDFETIESIGHQIRGAAGGFGLAILGEMGAALESSAHDRSANLIEKICHEIQDYLSKLEVVYK